MAGEKMRETSNIQRQTSNIESGEIEDDDENEDDYEWNFF